MLSAAQKNQRAANPLAAQTESLCSDFSSEDAPATFFESKSHAARISSWN
jgi:hypothetical protein